MFKWIALSVIVIASGVLGYLYLSLKNLEMNPSEIPPIEAANTVRVFHSFNDGIHRYAGAIKLPHSCFSIDTQISYDGKEGRNIILSITTKDNILEERVCSQISTRYQFDNVVDAPESSSFLLYVDGVARPTKITEKSWANPRGTIILK